MPGAVKASAVAFNSAALGGTGVDAVATETKHRRTARSVMLRRITRSFYREGMIGAIEAWGHERDRGAPRLRRGATSDGGLGAISGPPSQSIHGRDAAAGHGHEVGRPQPEDRVGMAGGRPDLLEGE